MDAISILKDDHRRASELLDSLEKGEFIEPIDLLLKRFEILIMAHMLSEEKIFYPAAKKHPEAVELIDTSYQEHEKVKELLQELSFQSEQEPEWKINFKALKEVLLSHIKEEEECLFPKIQKLIGEEQLKAIALQMEDFRNRGSKEIKRDIVEVDPAISS